MKMSFEEAIKSGVKQAMEDCELTIGMTLLQCVEKQIPKKVKQTFIGDIELVHCPSCGVRFFLYGMLFCGECGQRLDWNERNGGEENENQT